MGSFLRICRARNEEDRHQSNYCFQHWDLPVCLRGLTHPTCRTVVGCSGTRKELNFESTLTRSHPVDKTAGTRITSEGTAGNSSAGPLNTRGKGADTSRILGCHVVGERAVDIVQVAAIAIAGGMRVEDLARVPLSFPTYAGILVNAAAGAARQLGLTVLWQTLEGGTGIASQATRKTKEVA